MAASVSGVSIADLLSVMGQDLRLKIGVLEGATHITEGKNAKAIPVAEYAMYNEFGTQKIPSRPFLRFSLDTFGQDAWLPELADLLREGVAPEVALNRVGLQAQADIRRVIEEWASPPNAPSTIKRKRSKRDNPLVDSGDLLDAIDYHVGGAD